jgi:tRNA (guanine-N7-)-methyltransferase
MTTEAQKHLRPIRSFVRREGRMTTAQRQALTQLWPRFGLAGDGAMLDLAASFGRSAPVIVEIGFGNGESLLAMAAAQPQKNFIGVEVHRPGIGQLLMLLAERDIGNVRLVCDDAKEFLEQQVPDASLDAVQLFFPDPWPKARHHKRRLVQAQFVQLVRRKLRIGGQFHMATDWKHYAEHMLAVMTGAQGYGNDAGAGHYAARPEHRSLTKFERRGQRLGHGVWDLVFRKVDQAGE